MVPPQSQQLPTSGRACLKSITKTRCVNTDVQFPSHKGLHHTLLLSIFIFFNARLNRMVFPIQKVQIIHRLTSSLCEWGFLGKKKRRKLSFLDII